MPPQESAPTHAIFSCVVDSVPDYSGEAGRWFAVLTRAGRAGLREPAVRVAGEPSPTLLRLAGLEIPQVVHAVCQAERAGVLSCPGT